MNNHITYVTIAYDLYKNKIIGQLNAWERRGYISNLMFIDKNKDVYRLVLRRNPTGKLPIDIQLASSNSKKNAVIQLFNYLKNKVNSEDELIYIRRLGISVIYARGFFERTKAKVFYEIPTYPIDSGTTFLRKMVLNIEKFYCKRRVYPYILAEPACVQKKLKTLPSKMIPINNAVEVGCSDIIPRKSNEYLFVFFGNLQHWHGLENFLQAVENYNGEKLFSVNVYSSLTECYKDLSFKYRNSPRIKFCGESNPKSIEIKNTNKTIGVGGLAYKTRGADYDTSLKNKDYAAMGIPFIYVLPDLSFVDYKYAYCIKDISKIDIDEIINWFSSIYSEDLYSIIKEYARKNLTYDQQIEELYRMVKK